MAKQKHPTTQAVRALRQAKIPFEGFPYTYEEGGGTALFAKLFDVDERQVIKTLIMEDERKQPLIVLMHGDREVSTKALARQIGVKSIQPCNPKDADRYCGYQVGGTSPFGTRKKMPVYCEAGILELEKIYINGGKRGYIISMQSQDMARLLNPTPVSAAQD
ncbi:Cys-tRNA(Pro) deacylase [Solemya velesiana gill symbiont]|uniref:Cys-tRNA(Pro)/Cys-tRNA(Cys) deacylase n=1 Tax=Solemya velesiana gill symbiont TaxID=1918948 RepID=A0A1T2KW68_9GAMM|nr:Cys-tRNA(Pro) deacylase [Solemya velesiana gill symbiont]OOZ37099.1 aminoacyl-tRNA deacylase [Solemya velesiana gill symbiont]